jgi:hypothetical protein
MTVELVWMFHGPRAGHHMQMTPAQAARAEEEGWAQRCVGRSGEQMKRAFRDDHPQAVAFFAADNDRPLEPSPAAPAYTVKEEGAPRPRRRSRGR